MNTDATIADIMDVPQPPSNTGPAETPPPDPKRSTIYDSLKGLPVFYVNRRNRTKNRTKIDKTQRNQKAVRLINHAFKRGVEGMPDTRIECGNRDTYASSMPMFRGLKKALREQHRDQRLAALMDDQRCREHVRNETILAETPAREDSLVTWEDVKIQFQIYDNAIADYHRLAPVKPYENRGPLSEFHRTKPKSDPKPDFIPAIGVES